jgi:hypothetical protein
VVHVWGVVATPEDGVGSVGVPDQPSQSQGQIRARTRRKNP